MKKVEIFEGGIKKINAKRNFIKNATKIIPKATMNFRFPLI